MSVPEGWSRTTAGRAVTFTDKLNTIRMESLTAGAPPSVAAARRDDLPKLARTVRGFKPETVTTVRRKAGTAVKVTYLAAGPANAVTGKAQVDAVERYAFFRNGKEVVLTLSGPRGRGQRGSLANGHRLPALDVTPMLEVDSLYRFFHAGDDETLALQGVSFGVRAGELVAVTRAVGIG